MFLVIDGDIFGFDNKGNIPIKDEDYDLFFDMQKEGKQFKLKDIPTGTGLFDYIEEYIPEVIAHNIPTEEERLRALEMVMLEVL